MRNTRSNKPLQKEWLWPSRAVSLISFCKDSFPLKRRTNKLLRLKLVINLEYKSFHNNSHCNKTKNMFWYGNAAQNLKRVCTMYRVGLTQRHFRFTRVLKGQILCSRLTYPRCAFLCLLTNCLTSDLKANYGPGSHLCTSFLCICDYVTVSPMSLK